MGTSRKARGEASPGRQQHSRGAARNFVVARSFAEYECCGPRSSTMGRAARSTLCADDDDADDDAEGTDPSSSWHAQSAPPETTDDVWNVANGDGGTASSPAPFFRSLLPTSATTSSATRTLRRKCVRFRFAARASTRCRQNFDPRSHFVAECASTGQHG